MIPSWYPSAFRNIRTDSSVPQPPSVSSPVGADDSTTAGQQASALRQPQPQQQAQAQQQPQRDPDVFDMLPAAGRNALRGGYAQGGYEGVQKAVGENWYDIPEFQRRQILSRMTAGS